MLPMRRLLIRLCICWAVVPNFGTNHTIGKSIHSVNECMDLPISYNGKTNDINALYVPTVSSDLILGMDFWTAFRIRPVCCNVIESGKNCQYQMIIT